MKKGVLLGLAAVSGLGLLTMTGCAKNPHDNTREPEPWTDKPVENHHFDGGETDPYGSNTDKGGGGGESEGGGDKAPAKSE